MNQLIVVSYYEGTELATNATMLWRAGTPLHIYGGEGPYRIEIELITRSIEEYKNFHQTRYGFLPSPEMILVFQQELCVSN